MIAASAHAGHPDMLGGVLEVLPAVGADDLGEVEPLQRRLQLALRLELEHLDDGVLAALDEELADGGQQGVDREQAVRLGVYVPEEGGWWG